MAKLTAETITDEQIRELQKSARAATFDPYDLTALLCSIALGDRIGNRDKARAHLAETFNARTESPHAD